ncbi:MAG: hypothetical protein H7X77_05400 [Anaerolineae bacterium]|nr:hypothetical protein [Anaerolineae bacterium]
MGLPAQWTDPEHGVCLTLYAAIAHLKTQGIMAIPAKNTLHCVLTDQSERIIEPVYLPALGWVYPVTRLEGL